MSVHYMCRSYLFLLFAALIVLMSGCKKKEEMGRPTAPSVSRSDVAPAKAPAAAPVESSKALQEAGVPQKNKRKIILSHELALEVKSIADTVETLTQLADASGGYVFKSTRSSRDKRTYIGEIGIRVPAGKSSGILTTIRKMGRIDRENSTADDITEEYVDLDARLKNAQATEIRLKELYQRAGKISDVLVVEKELTRVRGEIEVFMARKRNWDLQTEMVTINLNLYESGASLPSSGRFWGPIRSGFGDGVEGFAKSLQGLIIFLGLALPWALGGGVLFFLMKKWKQRKSAANTVAVTVQEDRSEKEE